VQTDPFGNELDPALGFARGNILGSPSDDLSRFLKAQDLVRQKVLRGKRGSLGIFTGNLRDFPIAPSDLPMAEEWVGPAIFGQRLEDAIRLHLGASPTAETAVFNRTSGGLVAAVVAIATGGLVIALTQPPSSPHPSLFRGVSLARAEVRLVQTVDELTTLTSRRKPDLLVVTSVSSELDVIPNAELERAAEWSASHDIPCLLDDAYGARLRPVLFSGAKSLAFGATLAITNNDKVGLNGPRAGFMAGRRDLVRSIYACACELGQEARAPIALGVLTAIELYDPADLLEECRQAEIVSDALARVLGPSGDDMRRTPLGPTLTADTILHIALSRAGRHAAQAQIVPCEASAALAMILLRDHGILLVAASGTPGARPSIRIKPTSGALNNVGGAAAVASSVNAALDELADKIDDPRAIRRLLFELDSPE
jgi:L-seryl-tRNA(Ser) seleniumtransferase